MNDETIFFVKLTTNFLLCDLDDGNVIKQVLTRLTNRSTFPNILLRGKSIGGSDDLNQLHVDKLLAELIEKAGAIPRSDGSAK